MFILCGNHTNKEGLAIANWFEQNQKLPVTPPYSAICWSTEYKIVAAAIFNDYNGSSVEIHFNGPNGLTRSIIGGIVNYVFVQLKCNILLARVPRSSAFKSYLPRIGFKYLAIIPNYFGPKDKKDDCILYVLNKNSAEKWIN